MYKSESKGDFKSRHQEIGAIDTSSDLRELLETATDFTDMSFSEEEQMMVPKLTQIVMDVHQDLGDGNLPAAFEKLQWYFTKGPYADVETQEEMQGLLGNGVSGAFVINVNEIAEKHEGLFKLYHKLNSMLYGAKKARGLNGGAYMCAEKKDGN
jgi:hypothetical protein